MGTIRRSSLTFSPYKVEAGSLSPPRISSDCSAGLEQLDPWKITWNTVTDDVYVYVTSTVTSEQVTSEGKREERNACTTKGMLFKSEATVGRNLSFLELFTVGASQ